MVHQSILEPVQEVEFMDQDEIETIRDSTPRVEEHPPSPLHPIPIDHIIPRCQPCVDRGRYSFCDRLWPFCTKCDAEDTAEQCFHSYTDQPAHSQPVRHPQNSPRTDHEAARESSHAQVVPAVPPLAARPRRAASAAPVLQATFVPPARAARRTNERRRSQSPPPPPTTPREVSRVRSPQRSQSTQELRQIRDLQLERIAFLRAELELAEREAGITQSSATTSVAHQHARGADLEVQTAQAQSPTHVNPVHTPGKSSIIFMVVRTIAKFVTSYLRPPPRIVNPRGVDNHHLGPSSRATTALADAYVSRTLLCHTPPGPHPSIALAPRIAHNTGADRF
ncbi:hypothetical protein RSOLAG1IB_12687 [Rhizoctonia solani AG-1 IB]|uniref:Uncharacterized protein n=1 Tax=Thanatephorus cucumeris (strain AG1-IB / isolate 7/3/14) TaxID=1108050 RepID=A0A0B7G036_THACB|nr:hypothetical protein RSOLAG1IB_12687 [Rhizoctonia solani AG-1 IB]